MLFDRRSERLAVAGLIVIFCSIIALLTFLLLRNHTTAEQRDVFGETIKASVERLDSTVHELVIENRTQERIITHQQHKETTQDSAYLELRQLNTILEAEHRAALRSLQSTQKQRYEKQTIQVPTAPHRRLERFGEADSTAL